MPEPLWGQLVSLRPEQIDRIKHATPIAYVPWGAIEWHSYHAPVGLDGMQALGQCLALAQTLGGIVLPPFYVGTDTIKGFKGFPHTLEHSAEVVTRLCMEILEGLRDEGFRTVAIVTGHAGGGHQEALREAERRFCAEHPDMGVWLKTSFEPLQDVYPANHAARGETSFQLLFDPASVDLSTIPDGPAPTLDGDGVWGEDPRAASADEGADMLRLFVERVAPELQALLRRHAGRYADSPPGEERDEESLS